MHSSWEFKLGRVAVVSLPWGLDYDLAHDSFEVVKTDLCGDE